MSNPSWFIQITPSSQCLCFHWILQYKKQCNLDYNYEGYYSCSNHAITTLLDILKHLFTINYWSIMLCYHYWVSMYLPGLLITYYSCTNCFSCTLYCCRLYTSTICAIHFTAYIDNCAHFNRDWNLWSYVMVEKTPFSSQAPFPNYYSTIKWGHLLDDDSPPTLWWTESCPPFVKGTY